MARHSKSGTASADALPLYLIKDGWLVICYDWLKTKVLKREVLDMADCYSRRTAHAQRADQC